MPSGARMQAAITPQLIMASNATCDAVPVQACWSVAQSMKWLHISSAVTICFARTVNDTPKLAALLFAKKVAQTMSQRIPRMDDRQGLTANLITASLVLLASKFGLPVSTTHVSIGSIAGVGSSAGTLNWATLRSVLMSWLATLPLALAIGFTVSKLL
jgi:inorganic phosphate transporter, PiT family